MGYTQAMASDPTTDYFDDLVKRAVEAHALPREAWSEAQPSRCHANSEAFAQRFSEHEVVRGWLVIGGHWFMPHSVVRHVSSGRLIDITPDPNGSGAIPFVEHRGTEDDFTVLRKGRDGGWLYPPIPDALAVSAIGEYSIPGEILEMTYTVPTQARHYPQSLHYSGRRAVIDRACCWASASLWMAPCRGLSAP